MGINLDAIKEHFSSQMEVLHYTDPAENREVLRSWLPSELDALSNAATGEDKISATKEKALERACNIVNAALKLTKPSAPQPTSTKKYSTGEVKMNANTTQKSAPKAAGKKPVVAKSSEGRADVQEHDAKKIVMLVKDNPHREGTDSYKLFAALKSSKTVGAFVAAVVKAKIGNGTRGRAISDLKYRLDHKHCKLVG